jgi:hypothetical protein
MLPNADNAIIEPTKVRDYLLSTTHPVGRFKSVVFTSLGYTAESWEILAKDIRLLAHSDQVKLGQSTPYGQKYEVSGKLVGPNGRVGSFVSVWLVKPDDLLPRLVTAYPG